MDSLKRKRMMTDFLCDWKLRLNTYLVSGFECWIFWNTDFTNWGNFWNFNWGKSIQFWKGITEAEILEAVVIGMRMKREVLMVKYFLCLCWVTRYGKVVFNWLMVCLFVKFNNLFWLNKLHFFFSVTLNLLLCKVK